jgi:hypothetical protein
VIRFRFFSSKVSEFIPFRKPLIPLGCLGFFLYIFFSLSLSFYSLISRFFFRSALAKGLKSSLIKVSRFLFIVSCFSFISVFLVSSPLKSAASLRLSSLLYIYISFFDCLYLSSLAYLYYLYFSLYFSFLIYFYSFFSACLYSFCLNNLYISSIFLYLSSLAYLYLFYSVSRASYFCSANLCLSLLIYFCLSCLAS